MTRFQPRLPLFWKFQLAGWAAFIVVTLPLKLDLVGSVPAALFLCLTRDGSSFLITLGLRTLYRRFWTDTGKQMAVLVIMACGSAGILQNLMFFLLRETLPLEGEILRNRMMAFSLFYERMGLLFGWSFLYLGIRNALRAKQRELELALAKSAQQGAEIQMLRAQMSPHFLFNALNSIQTRVGHLNAEMGKMVQALSDFLRFSLDYTQKDYIPLRLEFEAISNYLAVEKIRFRDGLEFRCEMDEQVGAVPVPGIILQPLIENAVKYGRDTSELPLRINVNISRNATTLQITVANSGKWLEPAPREKDSHLGLENLRRRLGLIYPGDHRLDIADQEGWVTITIYIPIL